MTINYGKRKAGALTAASPGDTLYIPFASYNDSGDSEAMSGFAASDIEIFKNGGATSRATDSGYSLISDTGQYGDRIGLHRFSVSLFNTTDDTGFYDAGSQYHVAIDAVTIDGKTVRLFPAVFEIDTVDVNVTAFADTGIETRLTALSTKMDTGVPLSVWASATRELTGFAFDTGVQQKLDRMDTGLSETIDRTYAKVDTGISAEITAIDTTTAVSNLSNKTDTGVPLSVWASATRELTGFAFDTGIQQALARVDTGLSETIDRTYAKLDTGISAEITAIDATTLVSNLSNKADTGIPASVWQESRSSYADTGSFGYGVNLHELRQDTGAANHLAAMVEEYDTGRLPAEASATIDTGAVNQAVWQADATSANVGRIVNFGAKLSDSGTLDTGTVAGDTGAADRLNKWASTKLTDSGTFDTGTGVLRGSAATLDTGATKDAVWGTAAGTDGPGAIGAILDTGLADAVWKYSTSGAVGDTGSAGYAQGRLMAVKGDTGAAHLDAGRLGVSATASLDTGATKDAVWGTLPGTSTRELTGFAFDTGVQQKLDRMDTGLSETIDRTYAKVDTGISAEITAIDATTLVSNLSTKTDTGVPLSVWASAARTLTAFAFDTGVQQKLDRMDTGLSETIDRIEDFDTGLRALINRFDTGVQETIDRTLAKVDTGPVVLGANSIDTGVFTGTAAFANDTGAFVNSIWGATTRTLSSLGANVIDTGTFTGTAAKANDTGALEASISAGVWSHATRELTGFAFDTGIQQKLDRMDTGLTETADRTYAKVDTGISAEITAADATTLVNNLSNKTDTGVPLSVWESATRTLTALGANVIDTGTFTGTAAFANDTGALEAAISAGVWSAATRELTSFAFDTGVANTVWKESSSTYTGDTGSVGYAQGRLMAVKGDTGAAHLDAGRLGVSATASLDTGATKDAVWGTLPGTSTRELTGFAFDTGVAQTVWRESDSTYTDTGSFGYGVNVHKVDNDTGAAAHLAQMADEYDTGRLPAEATATLDTGATKDAVWGTAAGTDGPGTIGTILDTGLADAVWKYSTSGATGDTGSVGYAQGRLMAVKGDTGAAHLDAGRLGVSATATLDTGATKDAVWQTTPGTDGRGLTESLNIDTGISDTVWKQAARTLTSFAHDTGVADTVWKSSTSTYTGDTGSVGYAQGRLMAVKGDTGAAHLDQGRLGVVSDSGKMAAVLDTGKVASAVWTSHATRTLSALGANVIDTGTFTGTAALANDTGALEASISAGVWSAATRELTGFAFDTGIQQALARVDTGLSETIDRTYAKVDTGISAEITAVGTSVSSLSNKVDTGLPADVDADILGVTNKLDTGVPVSVWQESGSTYTDTGSLGYALDNSSATIDTGQVNQAVWQGDASRTLTAWAFDTGVQQKLDRMDTGLSETIDRIEDFDTGLRQLVNRFDTGINSAVDSLDVTDTGLYALINRFDTGAQETIDRAYAKADTGYAAELAGLSVKMDTGGFNVDRVAGDTGAAIHLAQMSDEYDTGRLPAEATATLDTGATKDAVWGTLPGFSTRELTGFAFDTGVQQKLDRMDTGARAVLDKIQFDTGGNEVHVDIRKVNNIQVDGTGDSGTEWGPVA